jgi:hypothetical protein
MPTKPKLSAPSRQRLEDLRGERIRPERVAMFLRGAAAFTPEQIEQLKNDGADIRTRAGIVLTADVPLDAVERVIGHDFVVASELSSPLYPEPKQDPSGDRE